MDNKQSLNLVPSLGKSLVGPLGNTVIDIGEVFLDTVFDEGILKEIPIIGTIASLTKAGISLRERNLAKNTYAFILGFKKQTLSEEDINNYRKRIANPKIAEKELGYALILLDKEVHYQKADILGRAYRNYVDGRITWEKFVEISESISRMFMADIDYLFRISKGTPMNFGVQEDELCCLQRLEGIGVVSEIQPYSKGSTLVLSEGYKVTSLGRCIIGILEEGFY